MKAGEKHIRGDAKFNGNSRCGDGPSSFRRCRRRWLRSRSRTISTRRDARQSAQKELRESGFIFRVFGAGTQLSCAIVVTIAHDWGVVKGARVCGVFPLAASRINACRTAKPQAEERGRTTGVVRNPMQPRATGFADARNEPNCTEMHQNAPFCTTRARWESESSSGLGSRNVAKCLTRSRKRETNPIRALVFQKARCASSYRTPPSPEPTQFDWIEPHRHNANFSTEGRLGHSSCR